MKNILTLFLFIFCLTLSAQDGPAITLSYEDTPFPEVIAQLEVKSGYSFYFAEDWLPEKKISGSFVNEPLANVLDSLLKETLLNFYIMDGNKVILTQNAIIVDQLPEDFFGRQDEAIPGDVVTNPLFYSEAEAETAEELEVVRIGKQDRNSSQA